MGWARFRFNIGDKARNPHDLHSIRDCQNYWSHNRYYRDYISEKRIRLLNKTCWSKCKATKQKATLRCLYSMNYDCYRCRWRNCTFAWWCCCWPSTRTVTCNLTASIQHISVLALETANWTLLDCIWTIAVCWPGYRVVIKWQTWACVCIVLNIESLFSWLSWNYKKKIEHVFLVLLMYVRTTSKYFQKI